MVNLKFWKKDGQDALSDFGGPDIEESDTSKDNFTEQPAQQVSHYQTPESRVPDASELNIIKIRLEGVQAKLEIIEHKLDLILTKFNRDRYY